MATTSTKARHPRRRGLALAACIPVVVVIAAACGSSGPSADEARVVLMAKLTDSGVSTEIANCIVDDALAQFEPGELVNSSGEASDEVDAAVADIVVECSTPETTIPESTVPTTMVPETTIPQTTVPETTIPEATTTVPDLDLTAFSAASEEVYIGLLAGDSFEAPAPATLEAYFGELIDRIDLAIVTAPSSDFSEQPSELLAAIESFDEELAANGYDVTLVPDDALEAQAEVVKSVKSDLEGFLEQCESTTDVAAEATELAEQLTALGDDVPPPVDGETRRAESDDGLISSDVPATWTSEASETVDDRRVFIVGTDAEGFTTSWGVDGVRFTGVDNTVDYVPLMDESDAARECTFLVEEDYEDALYVGKLRRYEGCGEGTEAVVVGARDIAGEGSMVIELQMIEFDEAVLDMIIASFAV